MSRNPYANPMGDDPLETEGRPARISGLAVSALIFGILCCIPGSGLISVILGGSGLIAISKAQGRLAGRTLALIGVFLGVIGSAGWLWVAVGARRTLSVADAQIFGPAVRLVESMEHKDWTAASKLISAKAGVSEADFASFATAVEAQMGPVVAGQHIDFWKFLSQQANVTVPGSALPIPMPMEFKNGTGVIVVVVDSWETLMESLKPGGSLMGKASNIGVIGNGKEIWLVAPGARKGGPALPGSKGSPAPTGGSEGSK